MAHDIFSRGMGSKRGELHQLHEDLREVQLLAGA